MTNDIFKMGQGIDFHPFAENRKLILGGVEIHFNRGLAGHSDADALCHAIGDALLGAAGLGDIGEHFPTSDPRWKDANSLKLLSDIEHLVWQAKFQVVNVDATLILEAPQIAPYRDEMRQNLAKALKITAENVSVKATTCEKMGFIGRGEGVAAIAVALLRKTS